MDLFVFGVVLVVMALGGLVLLLLAAERQRDEWKACADGLAAALNAEPELVLGFDVGAERHDAMVFGERRARVVSSALAAYNALLEPEDAR